MSLAILCEALDAVKYPVQDKVELQNLVSLLQRKDEMLKQEEADNATKIEEAQVALDEELSREKELREELAECLRVQQDVREITNFVKSFKSPKAVMVDGREVIAKIHNTRAKELEEIESLGWKIEDYKMQQIELAKKLHKRSKDLIEALAPFHAWVEEYCPSPAQRTGEKNDNDRSNDRQNGQQRKNGRSNRDRRRTPRTPREESEDVEMEIE